MSFHSGRTSPKGTIGTYKHGRIEWQSAESRSEVGSQLRSPSSCRGRRPQIQVVIPSAQRNRPLPTSPFFNQTNSGSHIRSASAELVTSQSQDVSPPSGSKKSGMRESMISPLSSRQRQTPVHFQALITTQMSKSSPELGSSDDSHEDDASSIYSTRSSMTSAASAEQGSPLAHTKPMNFHERSASATFSIKSPVTLGIFTEDARANSKSGDARPETGPRVWTQSSPRRYAPHPPIEEDHEFRPTCALHPTRTPTPRTSPRPSPQPSIFRTSTIRKSTISNRTRRSVTSSPAMGAIRHSRSASSKQFSPRSYPSPTLSEAENELELHLTSFMEEQTTLSEAENDLEQHLTSFTDDNPFKWDDLIEREDTSLYDPPTGPLPALPRKDSETIGISGFLPDLARQDSTTVGRYSPVPVVHRKDSVTINVAGPPPALPRKSSKRHSQFMDSFRLSRVPGDHIVSQLKRNRSLAKANGLSIQIPNPKRMTDDFILSPIPIPPKAPRRAITPEIAENVILRILFNLESLDDLFTTAIVNRGFYRVFKRHELDLMKSSLRKMSPPAWEHREICYPGHDRHDPEDLETARPRQDYTPTSYLQYYTRDMYIIAALKSLIKDKCESFVRPEISAALGSNEPADMARVDDALWRIWTFCKIFGCGKNREEDIVAQMDWLKGGLLVHQKVCTFSIQFESIDMNDTLANAPECFALGNEGGLSAEQLFDMMELWNCLGVLLQPFEGRTIQAREHGVYENTEVRGGDIDGEEAMLDEWYYYLLTLGLSAVLDLAAPCRRADSSAFVLASQNGWIDWAPPVFGGTRRNFLKEAASRVYEDKIAMTYAESSTKEVQRQLSKQRIQNHITELRRRKNSGERRPEIRMSQERPISEWEDVIAGLNRPRPAPTSNLVSHIPSLRSAAPISGSSLNQQLLASVSELPIARTSPVPARPASPPRRTVAMPLLPSPPPSTVPTDWDHRNSMAPSMPSIDEHPAFRTRRESIPDMPSLESHPYFTHQHLPQHQQSEQQSQQTQPGSARSATHSASGSHSSEGDQRPAFQQHPAQRIHETDSAENTADKAIYRIVEMGFTPEAARQALRLTDQGDGLRVDRAVELLLRSM